MHPIVPLNLPKAALQLRKQDDRIYVRCLVRRKELVLSPEEWVRQHLIAYFVSELQVPIERIAVEKQLQFEGFTKRWDLVIYNRDFSPELIVECKAPSVPLTLDTLHQALRYQRQIQATFIVLSNGLEHRIYERDATALDFIERADFPEGL
ncbi:MAG: hypothetical protein RLZZ301_296 [Bacteroidota bacterium]|jgi:hypothetical protein